MNRFLEIFNVITLVVIALLIVGGIAVVNHDITFKEYFDDCKWLVGLTAVGRGLAAQGRVN